MARFRQIHCAFWEDAHMIDLTPENRYFYLYLLTNPRTTQCGIYELPYQVMSAHTGYNREAIMNLIERFVNYGKILYNDSTKEIMVLNWIKYNGINSPKVRACIKKELGLIKHQPFVEKFLEQCKLHGYRIDTVSIPYQNGMDTPSIPSGEEEEREEEETSSSSTARMRDPLSPDFQTVNKAYEQYFGMPGNYTLIDMLLTFVDDGMKADLIVEVFKYTRENGAGFQYAKTTIVNLFNEKIFTAEQFKAAQAAFAEQKAAQEQIGATRQGGEQRAKDQQRDGKPADSITGGKTGWIARQDV